MKEQLANVQSACRSRLLRRKTEEKVEQQRALYQKLIETTQQMARQAERAIPFK